MSDAYMAPIDQLLNLGDPRDPTVQADYRALGIGPEHAAELRRLLRDHSLSKLDSEDPRVWAQLHAWRAIGQLRLIEAAPSLLELAEHPQTYEDYDERHHEELPPIFADFGPEVVPLLIAHLADESRPHSSRNVCVASLTKVAQLHPQLREQVIQALSATIARPDDNNQILNADVVAALLNLKAIEALPAIRAVYASRNIDASMCGQYSDVRQELGVPDTGDDPPDVPDSLSRLRQQLLDARAAIGQTRGSDRAPDRDRLRDKRKRERQNRKKNRRR